MNFMMIKENILTMIRLFLNNQSLISLDCTHLKKVRSDRAINYGKRKVSEASRELAKNISEALEQPSLSGLILVQTVNS